MQSIQNEIDMFEQQLCGLLRDEEASVQILLDYLARQQGGRLRPKLLLLTAGMAGGITTESHTLACLVELLHTASLVHDDVVDEAGMRRRMESVNAVFDNKLAVLLGDYLLAKVLGIASQLALPEVWPLLSDTVRQLTRGEMVQLSRRGCLDLAEADYFRFLEWKTASLMELSCRLGALSAGASKAEQEAYGQWGRDFGIFFQLKDDLKDFSAVADGKDSYSDLREGEVTLPVMYAMQRLSLNGRADFRRRYLKIQKPAGELEALAATVRDCGALHQAGEKLSQMQTVLLQQLEGFPESVYRLDLQQLVRETGNLQFLDIK